MAEPKVQNINREKTTLDELLRIQKELKVPKNQFNNFGKYSYRSCEDILDKVKPLLGNTPLIITDEIVQIGDRFYVKSTAMLGDIEVTGFAREEENKKGMDGSQITGSASSYARKYALNGLFLIDDTKDADATNDDDDKKPEKKKPLSLTKPESEEKPEEKPKSWFDEVLANLQFGKKAKVTKDDAITFCQKIIGSDKSGKDYTEQEIQKVKEASLGVYCEDRGIIDISFCKTECKKVNGCPFLEDR